MASKAALAIQGLRKRFMTPDEIARLEFGMGVKPYILVCHSCGKLHVQRSEFISSPLSLAVHFDDDSTLQIGAAGCAECCQMPGAIRRAWEHGTTPEARARFESEVRAGLITPDPNEASTEAQC